MSVTPTYFCQHQVSQPLAAKNAPFFSKKHGRPLAWLSILRVAMTAHLLCSIWGPGGALGEPAGDASFAALEIPKEGAYTGAYIDFGDFEDDVSLEAIEKFEKMVGKKQAIIGYSSFWGRQRFPLEAATVVNNYGAVSLIYWNPWDGHGKSDPNRFRLEEILAGTWDKYIDTWATAARDFQHPLLVSWGLEMNGNWFPWSGVFSGGGTLLEGRERNQFQGPETFKKAYRYVVDRVRAKGARNIAWVFHPNNTSDPEAPWNVPAAYYPGDEYADWLAYSAYGKQYPGPGWVTFDEAFTSHYNSLVALSPEKPVLLAEWGIGEFPEQGDKGQWLSEAFSAMRSKFPRLKGAVFWHERWQNGDLSYSNLRVHSSLKALRAYQRGVKDPFWLGRPLLREIPAARPLATSAE